MQRGTERPAAAKTGRRPIVSHQAERVGNAPLRATDWPRSALFLTPGQSPPWQESSQTRKESHDKDGRCLLTDEGLREALPRRQRDSVVMWSRGSQKPFSLGATRNGEFREI
jgi:hypothetical protein